MLPPGGGTPDIATLPVYCQNCIGDNTNTPCGILNYKTNSDKYKKKFIDLNKPSVFNLNHESGFAEVYVSGIPQLIDGVPDGKNHLIVPDNATSGTHVHNNNMQTDPNGNIYDGTVKILSPEDLQRLVKTFMPNNILAGNSPIGTHIDMISNEGIFSLAILDNNINYLTDVAPILMSLNTNYIKKSAEILEKGLNATERKKQMQIMMLELLKTYNLDSKIGLFEGTVETLPTTIPSTSPPVNDIKINWTQNSLKPNGIILKKPC